MRVSFKTGKWKIIVPIKEKNNNEAKARNNYSIFATYFGYSVIRLKVKKELEPILSALNSATDTIIKTWPKRTFLLLMSHR